jgi:S1-C subfamily serine protease
VLKEIVRLTFRLISLALLGVFASILFITAIELTGRRYDFRYDNPPIDTRPRKAYYISQDPVVRIKNYGGFVCSGVVVSAEYVLTAAHCVKGLDQEIGVHSAKDHFINFGKVVGIDDSQDMALIHVYIGETIKPAKVDFTGVIGTKNPIWIKTCGFPAGQAVLLCTEGILNGNYYFKRIGSGILYQGMSGGPVYDSITNTVIGVNSAVNAMGIVIGPTVGIPEKFNTKEVRE